MKRNAPEMTYYYHVLKVDNGYKVKRTIFPKRDGSLFCGSTKDSAEKYISLLIQKNNQQT